MKKIIFVILTFMFVNSLCFAQQSSSISPVTLKLLETKTFAGKVEWITSGDPINKISPRITVVDENGKRLSFEIKTSASVTPATIISDKDGNTITFSTITRGSKVALEYAITKKGINKAKSIKLVTTL